MYAHIHIVSCRSDDRAWRAIVILSPPTGKLSPREAVPPTPPTHPLVQRLIANPSCQRPAYDLKTTRTLTSPLHPPLLPHILRHDRSPYVPKYMVHNSYTNLLIMTPRRRSPPGPFFFSLFCSIFIGRSRKHFNLSERKKEAQLTKLDSQSTDKRLAQFFLSPNHLSPPLAPVSSS